ncbi:MAG: hypothetical protein KDK90_22145, partial [Leptospiraceae bacterium]|nr:hypothetical protein [Leptospiraceae bacterium]
MGALEQENNKIGNPLDKIDFIPTRGRELDFSEEESVDLENEVDSELSLGDVLELEKEDDVHPFSTSNHGEIHGSDREVEQEIDLRAMHEHDDSSDDLDKRIDDFASLLKEDDDFEEDVSRKNFEEDGQEIPLESSDLLPLSFTEENETSIKDDMEEFSSDKTTPIEDDINLENGQLKSENSEENGSIDNQYDFYDPDAGEELPTDITEIGTLKEDNDNELDNILESGDFETEDEEGKSVFDEE